MRAFRAALVLTIVSVACAPTAERSPISTGTRPSTSTSLATTTTNPTTSAHIRLTLDEVEALALDRGIRLEISYEDGVVLGWLDRNHPKLDVDPSIRTVTIRYLSADGQPTDVVWDQDLDTPVTTVRQPWRGRAGEQCVATLPDGSTAPVVLVWQSGGDSATYIDQLDGAGGAVTVVSPVWWRMSSDGSVVGSGDISYVDAVHSRNVAIWPAVAGFDAETHHLVFSNAERRSALAAQISEEARTIGADGVNIDIEGYRVEDSEGFLAWVEELTALVHDWGGVVSHDLVPRSDTWEVGPEELSFWSTAPLRTELAMATDCTVLMAYDQHNQFRPPGPVASPQWVEDVLIYELRHTDPAQLVLGVPFYGRVWDPEDLKHPETMGIGEMERLVADGEVSFDASYGLNRVDLADGRFFWAETTTGLEHRFDLVADYGLAGWAGWRFGFDSPDLWAVFERSGRISYR